MSYLTNINISVFYNSKKNEKSNVTTFQINNRRKSLRHPY